MAWNTPYFEELPDDPAYVGVVTGFDQAYIGNEQKFNSIKQKLGLLKEKLGGPGASKKAAESIYALLNEA